MKKCCVLSFLLCLLTSLSAVASNALRGKCFQAQATEEREELVVHPEFHNPKARYGINYDHIQAMVPTNMQATNDAEQVLQKISSRTGTSIAKSEQFRNSPLYRKAMQTAKRFQESASFDMSFKTSQPAPAAPAPRNIAAKQGPAPAKPIFKATEHKFNFNVQPLKGNAKMVYNGYVNSKIEYRADNDTLRVSIEEALSKNSHIALSHEKNQFEQRQFVQYNISW